MRVLVCGSRDWTDKQAIREVLATLPDDAVVVHGAARGADTLAGMVARERGLRTWEFPADWRTYGRAAGPIRNQQMLDQAQPHTCIAFRRAGASKGTDDMVRRAKAAGLEVLIVHGPPR